MPKYTRERSNTQGLRGHDIETMRNVCSSASERVHRVRVAPVLSNSTDYKLKCLRRRVEFNKLTCRQSD